MARRLDSELLLRLVDALAPGGWISGNALAQAGGISRAAVAKRIAHLADWGLAVESRRGRGYRLAAPLRRLDAAAILAALPMPWRRGLRVTVTPVIDSTNARLLESPIESDPQALLAEMQSAGRGRRGRAWRSPFGANVYLSLAWSYPAWPARLSALPLALGVACVRALRRLGLDGVGLKWPNDLWARGAKLGGILVEQRGEAGGVCRLVVGVGINVSMRAEQAGAIDQPWVSLDELAPALAPCDRNALAAALLAELASALLAFPERGFAPFAAEWSALDLTAGRRVRVLGAQSLEGLASGVDEEGRLRVTTDSGVVTVAAGDVSLRW